jgi:hypothetical protein
MKNDAKGQVRFTERIRGPSEFLRFSMRFHWSSLLANYVSCPNPRNDISKRLNRNANGNKRIELQYWKLKLRSIKILEGQGTRSFPHINKRVYRDVSSTWIGQSVGMLYICCHIVQLGRCLEVIESACGRARIGSAW